MIGHPSRARVGRVPQHALKEWAVTIAALAAGDQVLIVRKGGIGEKRFELPHPRFYLFPTYAHQRPELVKPAARDRFADPLAQREDPAELPLAVHAELLLVAPDRRPGGARGDRPPPRARAHLRGGAPALAAQAPAVGGCAARVVLPGRRCCTSGRSTAGA